MPKLSSTPGKKPASTAKAKPKSTVKSIQDIGKKTIKAQIVNFNRGTTFEVKNGKVVEAKGKMPKNVQALLDAIDATSQKPKYAGGKQRRKRSRR